VLGELAGWFIGWDLLLEYTAIVAVVAIGISGYFSFLVGEMGADLPAWMLGAPGTGDGHRVDLFAALLFTFMLGVTRVWFSMSRDGLLPKWFAKTHPTRHVPTRVTWIVGWRRPPSPGSCRSARRPS
jgi:amino acid transporter